MNLEQAIDALRSLDLPQPRRVELIRRLVNAPTTGAWFVIVSQAKQEARQASHIHQAVIDAAYVAGLAEARRRGSSDAAEKPQEARRAPKSIPKASVDPKPVIVSWTTPRPSKAISSKPKRTEHAGRKRGEGPEHFCPPDHSHTVWVCYQRHKCRCAICKAAKAQVQREYLARRKERGNQL